MLSGFTTIRSRPWFRTAVREVFEPERLLDRLVVLIDTQGPIEIPSVEPGRRHGRHSFDGGPTRNLVQHGDLAERVAGLHLPDNLSVHNHPGDTREYDEQALVFVTLHCEQVSRTPRFEEADLGNASQPGMVHSRKERDPAQ